jgi:predicted lipoprotein with Yx(FWY)xxD motif
LNVPEPEEEPLQRARPVVLAPIAMAVLIAACGGSSKTTTKSHASSAPSTSTSTSAASSSSSGASSAALITTKHNGKLGTILAYGNKKLTVYLFEGDKGKHSSCTGACASLWPPVTGKPEAASGAMSSDLGTIKRADGSTQITYKGHPLYLYAKDKDDEDAYGEGIKSFGAEWYALAPSGKKVDLS